MIKINLLQGGALSNAGLGGLGLDGDSAILLSPEENRKEALKRIVILIMFPAALYFYEQQSLPSLYAELANINNEMSTLSAENSQNQAVVEQIKKIQESQIAVEKQVDLVRRINSEKNKEIKVLDLFQNVIPETVWFRELDYKDSVFSIRGYALSDSDVSTFVEALSKSVHFVSVNLISSAEEKIEDSIVKSFEIRCMTEMPKPKEGENRQ